MRPPRFSVGSPVSAGGAGRQRRPLYASPTILVLSSHSSSEPSPVSSNTGNSSDGPYCLGLQGKLGHCPSPRATDSGQALKLSDNACAFHTHGSCRCSGTIPLSPRTTTHFPPLTLLPPVSLDTARRSTNLHVRVSSSRALPGLLCYACSNPCPVARYACPFCEHKYCLACRTSHSCSGSVACSSSCSSVDVSLPNISACESLLPSTVASNTVARVEPSVLGLSYNADGRYIPIPNRPSSPPGWKFAINDPGRSSYLSVYDGQVDTARMREWFDLLAAHVDWSQPYVKGRPMPRCTAWCTRNGCSCAYRYGGTTIPASAGPLVLDDITAYVSALCGFNPTEFPDCCNINWYKDGSHMVGWHADNEPIFGVRGQDTVIVSLSLGALRDFSVKLAAPLASSVKFPLANGALCAMEGRFQTHYLHAVQKNFAVRSPRINLTWRWIRNHSRKCAGGIVHPSHSLGPGGVDDDPDGPGGPSHESANSRCTVATSSDVRLAPKWVSDGRQVASDQQTSDVVQSPFTLCGEYVPQQFFSIRSLLCRQSASPVESNVTCDSSDRKVCLDPQNNISSHNHCAGLKTYGGKAPPPCGRVWLGA